MPTHKSEDYKLSAVEYYLTEDKHKKKFVKYSNVLHQRFKFAKV
jgi:hypothetical protein